MDHPSRSATPSLNSSSMGFFKSFGAEIHDVSVIPGHQPVVRLTTVFSQLSCAASAG